jgi:hypothetical protein
MSKRTISAAHTFSPQASASGAPPSNFESPWKKLCFDGVEDIYLCTKPEPTSTSSLRLKKTKNVHFSNCQEVVEVPSRYDYLQAGIQLWWSRNDMNLFYRDSRATC